MGLIKRMFFSFVVTSVCFLFGCASQFNSASLQIGDIDLKKAYADSSQAYYLSEQGVLYSPGADLDASCYVSYLDQQAGIVAENVRSFGVMAGGGYYITGNNELFLYNQNTLSHYNYTTKKTHQRILTDVMDATATPTELVWIDQDRNLYFAGTIDGESYFVDKPCFLGGEAVVFSIGNGFVLWVDEEGYFHSFGAFDSQELSQLNQVSIEKKVCKLFVGKNYKLILCEGELFLQGECEFYKRTEEERGEDFVKLASSISDFDCSYRTLGAKTENGEFLLWGRIIANDANETYLPHYEFVKHKMIEKNVKSIFVWDSNAGYIDSAGKSNIFHSDMGWTNFYGNSSEAPFVGIYNIPRTWVNKK